MKKWKGRVATTYGSPHLAFTFTDRVFATVELINISLIDIPE